MPDSYGYSFSPDASTRQRQGINSGVLPQNASEALRILSLHLPASLGGNPIAPDALLRPQLPGRGPTAQPGPVASSPFGPSPSDPRASAGPVATSPFGNSPSPAGGLPPLPQGDPTLGFKGGTAPMLQPPGPPSQAPVNPIMQLLSSLFSGYDVGGGGGSYGGGGGGRFV